MLLLEQGKVEIGSGESKGTPSSPAPEHYDAEANRPGVLPRPSVAQQTIVRLFSVMNIPPENLLIGIEMSDAIAEQLGKFEKAVRRCRLDLSGEAVHNIRVHCRRLIARLVLIEMAIPATNLHATKKPLKQLLKILGGLRDVQVQKAALSAELARQPEVGGLWIELGQREQELIRSSSRLVSEFKMGKLRRRLMIIQAELKNPAAHLAAKSVLGDSIIRATHEAFDEVVLRTRAISSDDVSTVHRVRIAFKRFRYMVESLPETVGRLSNAKLSALDGYQQAMGSIQDVQVLLDFLTTFSDLHPEVAWSLASFKNTLQERRRQLAREFMTCADKVHSFWPLQSTLQER
jgi:CHAD domain-containing protein